MKSYNACIHFFECPEISPTTPHGFGFVVFDLDGTSLKVCESLYDTEREAIQASLVAIRGVFDTVVAETVKRPVDPFKKRFKKGRK